MFLNILILWSDLGLLHFYWYPVTASLLEFRNEGEGMTDSAEL